MNYSTESDLYIDLYFFSAKIFFYKVDVIRK